MNFLNVSLGDSKQDLVCRAYIKDCRRSKKGQNAKRKKAAEEMRKTESETLSDLSVLV